MTIGLILLFIIFFGNELYGQSFATKFDVWGSQPGHDVEEELNDGAGREARVIRDQGLLV